MNRVELRYFSEYSEDYLSWLNDYETNRYTSRGVYPVTETEARQYVTNCQSADRIVFGIWADKVNHVGNISLQKIDFLNRSAELAILLGDKKARGKGVGHTASMAACYIGFNRLGLNRIYCGTHEDNVGMRKIALKLGMREEGRSRQAFIRNGKASDIIHYGMLKEEFVHYADCRIHEGQPLPNNAG